MTTVARTLGLAFITTISLLLIGVGTSAFYDLIKAVAGAPTDVGIRDLSLLATLTVLAGTLIAGLIAIPAARRAFSSSRARMWRIDRGLTPQFRAVILMPSVVRNDLAPLTQQALTLAEGEGSRQERLGKLCRSIDLTKRFWPWQQTLRLAQHNFDRLELVVCLVSKEARKEFPALKSILSRVGPENTRVVEIVRDVDTNDYNDVEEALNEAIRLCVDGGIPLSDVCIDITSGTKAYSAAATVKTLNSPIRFSYVHTQTSGEEGAVDSEVGQVIIYDTITR